MTCISDLTWALCKCAGGFVVWTDTAGWCRAAKSFWKALWGQEQCHVGIPQVSASTLSKDLGLELLPVFSLRNSKNQEWKKRRWRKSPSFTGQPAEGKQRQAWGTSMWMLEVMPRTPWFHYALLCWGANGSPFNPSLPPFTLICLFFPPSFYLFSQVALLPFFLPLPVSSTTKKATYLRMVSTGDSVGIIQLPEHRHKTWFYEVLPGCVLHALDSCDAIAACHPSEQN